jgi:predicted transcriptional regulator of viral defense system
MSRKETNHTYNYIEDYLDDIRSKGRYAFTLEELKERFNNNSDKALLQSLYRLKSKKKIVQVRKEFYTLLPPEYIHQGVIPTNFFIDDMMMSLEKDYYIGIISAAALYGASHQQSMETFIITKKPALRNIKNKKLKINFLVKNDWDEEDINKIKTDAGYIKVSSPELTALDLLYYIDKLGINRVYTILEELTEELKPSKLYKTAKKYNQLAAIQRLGFLLEKKLNCVNLAQSIYSLIENKKGTNIPLVPGKYKEGEVNAKWRIIDNVNIESDL